MSERTPGLEELLFDFEDAVIQAERNAYRRSQSQDVVKAREAVFAALNEIERLRKALALIADAPAWGAPGHWETTPADLRQFARAARLPVERDQLTSNINSQDAK